MNKFVKIITDFKTWIAALAVVVAIAAGVTGFAMLPKRVAAVEQDTKAVKDQVQALAADVDKYVALNEAQKKDTDDREKLMLELIKATKGAQ